MTLQGIMRINERGPIMKSSNLYRILAVILLLSCLLTMALPMAVTAEESVDAEYEAKKAAYRAQLMADDVTTDDLLIGSWVTFYSFEIDSYEYQLDQMAAAGINFNMFPKNFGSGAMFDADYWADVEAQYAKRNMVYQMNGSMAEKNIAIGVEYAAGKEHCIGYHLVDEPGGGALQGVADMVHAYREADATRYPFVNLLPSYAGEAVLGGTYYEHVSRFVELAGAENIDYLSHDYYPFRDGGVVLTGIYADMEVIRKVAYENGKLKTHAFPQSTAWNGTRMPSIDEMRWNVYAYLAYGFKALSWFNLVCPGSSDSEGEGFNDSLIYRDGTIRDPELYAFWSDLNWEIRGLSDILMNQDVAHAYHVHKTAKNVEYLPDDFFLQPKGKNDFVVSVMESKKGEDKYIMLFNKNYERGATCHFSVDASAQVKWLEYFDPQIGEYTPVEFQNGMLEDEFLPGEGRLYRLRYDDPATETEKPAETTEHTTEDSTEHLSETTAESISENKTEVTDNITESASDSDDTRQSGCRSAIGSGYIFSLCAASVAIISAKSKKRA